MKFVMRVCLLLACGPVLGAGVSIDSSAADIPVAFSTASASSKVLQCSGNRLQILNQTAEVLAIGVGSPSGNSVPSADFDYVPSGPNAGNVWNLQSPFSGEYIYLRGVGGAISSGTVQVACSFGR